MPKSTTIDRRKKLPCLPGHGGHKMFMGKCWTCGKTERELRPPEVRYKKVIRNRKGGSK